MLMNRVKITNLKFPIMTLGILAGCVLSSCSIDVDNDLVKPGNGNMLAKAPNVIAYSGEHTWGNTNATRSADVNANQWAEKWDCPVREAKDLNDTELAELKALLSPGVYTENNIIIPFENYWVQQIYKGESTYDAQTRIDTDSGEDVLGSNQMNHLEAYDGNPWGSVWDPSLNQTVPHPYGHINNFNYGDNNNAPGVTCGHNHGGTTLMVDMPLEGVTPNNQYGYEESWGTNPKFYNNYLIVEYKGYYYVGFDYEAHKPEVANDNQAADVDRDWNFTDWIVRICPAYPIHQTPEENPGGVENPGGDVDPGTPGTPDFPFTPIPGVLCTICGDVAHMPGECPNEDCDSEECRPQNGENPVPGDDVVAEQQDEVEINLALDQKNDDLLESHLSMHVRSATNVEVFIPVPAQYYCDVDDMDIVLNHKDDFVHGGPYRTEYDINGNIVSLNVAFEEDGIRIWTEGITQEVIDFCWENFKDGITFEVWNYFNNPETGLPNLSIEQLKEYLDRATVKFIDGAPEKYVNAFTEGDGFNGKYGSDNLEGNDFHVTPESPDNFNSPYEGPHKNGATVNDIYDRK